MGVRCVVCVCPASKKSILTSGRISWLLPLQRLTYLVPAAMGLMRSTLALIGQSLISSVVFRTDDVDYHSTISLVITVGMARVPSSISTTHFAIGAAAALDHNLFRMLTGIEINVTARVPPDSTCPLLILISFRTRQAVTARESLLLRRKISHTLSSSWATHGPTKGLEWFFKEFSGLLKIIGNFIYFNKLTVKIMCCFRISSEYPSLSSPWSNEPPKYVRAPNTLVSMCASAAGFFTWRRRRRRKTIQRWFEGRTDRHYISVSRSVCDQVLYRACTPCHTSTTILIIESHLFP